MSSARTSCARMPSKPTDRAVPVGGTALRNAGIGGESDAGQVNSARNRSTRCFALGPALMAVSPDDIVGDEKGAAARGRSQIAYEQAFEIRYVVQRLIRYDAVVDAAGAPRIEILAREEMRGARPTPRCRASWRSPV